MDKRTIKKATREMGQKLSLIPQKWEGKSAILEMKKAGSTQWKQMEWMGFYFEFLCEKFLEGIAEILGLRYGNTSFDALNKIPWDFKMHATNTSSHKIVINDREAIEKGLKEYGAVGIIIAMGDVTYNDEKRKFQKWHEKLKGKMSEYTKKRIKRGAWSRFRKVAVELRQISFIKIDEKLLENAGSFQRGFRNADGSLRREKVLLDLEKVEEDLIHSVDF